MLAGQGAPKSHAVVHASTSFFLTYPHKKMVRYISGDSRELTTNEVMVLLMGWERRRMSNVVVTCGSQLSPAELSVNEKLVVY